MGYTDAQGRPEIFMHPDILAGKSTFNIVESASEDLSTADADNNDVVGAKKNRRPPKR
ncbi:hypothetical protein [Rhodococcus baikonurensis]|uniref:Uncharacterized protein n=1 Tax=Rhodococcus baikonurensis TaxID=172041 RepID=A0ABV5XKE0_9NOCA